MPQYHRVACNSTNEEVHRLNDIMSKFCQALGRGRRFRSDVRGRGGRNGRRPGGRLRRMALHVVTFVSLLEPFMSHNPLKSPPILNPQSRSSEAITETSLR